MNTAGRFQSAKNLQPARSLRTPAQNRNGPGNYGLPLEQSNPYQHNTRQQNNNNNGGGVGGGGFGGGYNLTNNGYRTPSVASSVSSANGFKGNGNFNNNNNNNNGNGNGLHGSKNGLGQRRHDVLRSPNTSLGSNSSAGSVKEIPTIVTFSSTTLAVGTVQEVYISYVENGPKLFTVQLKAKEHSLNQMMAALERVPLRNLTRKPTLGMACIARFSEDRVLYRALIMGINIDSCLVSYVDFGNTETVEFKNLYEIPQEFLKHKVFSMRFTLSNVKTLEDSNADIAGLFSSLVMDKVLNLKVMPLEGPAFVQYCELYENNENIFEKLLNLCKAKPLKYPGAITLDRGSNCLIIIRYIESCRQFYIQPLENVERFEKLMDQLAEFCRKSSTFNVMNVGDSCAACLSSDECYRAEVVSVAGSKVKVRLVDYGNTITLEKNQVKRLSPKFVDEQPQVVECCLEGFQEISDDNLSTAQLEMLSENESGDRKQFRMVVTDVHNGVAIVTLLDEASTPPLNISKRLLKLNNPAKFMKDQMQQAQQQKMSSGTASKPQQAYYTPPPAAIPQAPVPTHQPSSSTNPFHSTSIISEVPNLSQTSPPRMGESEVIDLTNDEWPTGNVQPLGHHSSGYEQQHNYQNNNNTGGNGYRAAGGPANGSSRGARDNNNPTRDLSQSSSSTFGGNKKERYQRPDIPRFTKERNQTPYYIEHDDRCESNNNYDQQDKAGRGRDKPAPGQRNNRYSGSGSESGFNTQSGDRASLSQESWKSSTATVDSTDDFVPYDFALTEQIIPMNTKVDIKLSWWVSPEEFYVRMKDEETKFEDMMKQIQKYYRNKPVVSDVPPVGATVIARYQKHNTCYRAKVIKYNESLGKFKVELVDCGTRAIVTGSDLWKLERRFVKLPKLAIQCTLANIKINCDPKELQNKIDRYINNEQPIDCVFLDKSEDKYLCDVETQGADLKMALLKDNLIAQILTDVDLKRLKGQTLKLKLVEIKSLEQFRVKLQGNDAILNCRHVEHAAYQQSVAEEIQTKWLDQYCFGHIEDVSSDERLILALLIPPLSSQAAPTIVDMPVLQSKFTATLTYVHEVNCVYVQNAKWADEVGKQLDDMFDYYEKSGTGITNLQMNELCASKSADGNWYRSKIISLQEIDNIEVVFVDYGNRERVKHEDLKVLEEQFREYSAFAHEVYLPMACLNEGDEDKLKKEIANLTGQYEMELKVLDYRNDIWIVDIASNDYSIVQALKDKQLAKDLDHEEIFNRKTVANESIEIVSAGQPEVGEDDQKNQKLEGCVSHVDNPNQLFVQLKSDLDDLDQLQENLQIISQALPGLKDFSVERYCIAPYSADDLWYRAKIIDSHDDLIIQFVDYGNSDVITSNKKHELKDVNDSLMKFKIYAKQCSLLVGPVAGRGWSEEAINILRDLEFVDVQFLVECRGVNYINLKCGERDLAEELIAKNLAERMEYVPSEQRCFTSHIESIQEFYLQLERDITPLDVMADYMARFEEFAAVSNPTVGSIYVAEFPDDGLWYRAKILQILEGSSFEVFFIDYGNTSVVTNVRELEKAIAELPPICTKCILRLPDGVKSWSDEAETKFKEIAAMGETVFTVQLHSPGVAATVELFLEGNNINEQLLDLCEKGAANVMNSSFLLNEETSLDNSFPLEGFVHVSHVNSPADFYIQFKNSHDALKNMEELLMIRAAQSERLMAEDVTEGMLCLAYSKSYDKFHRAMVMSKEHHQYKVHLLDHGSNGFATDLRQMPDEIQDISVLAKRCCLETYSSDGSGVLDVVQKRFLELVDSGRTPFSFEIVRNDVEPNVVRLFTEDGRNVEDLLELPDGNDNGNKMPTVAAARPPPTPSELIKTSQRAKPKQAFLRAKSDLEFDQ